MHVFWLLMCCGMKCSCVNDLPGLSELFIFLPALIHAWMHNHTISQVHFHSQTNAVQPARSAWTVPAPSWNKCWSAMRTLGCWNVLAKVTHNNMLHGLPMTHVLHSTVNLHLMNFTILPTILPSSVWCLMICLIYSRHNEEAQLLCMWRIALNLTTKFYWHFSLLPTQCSVSRRVWDSVQSPAGWDTWNWCTVYLQEDCCC